MIEQKKTKKEINWSNETYIRNGQMYNKIDIIKLEDIDLAECSLTKLDSV